MLHAYVVAWRGIVVSVLTGVIAACSFASKHTTWKRTGYTMLELPCTGIYRYG